MNRFLPLLVMLWLGGAFVIGLAAISSHAREPDHEGLARGLVVAVCWPLALLVLLAAAVIDLLGVW